MSTLNHTGLGGHGSFVSLPRSKQADLHHNRWKGCLDPWCIGSAFTWRELAQLMMLGRPLLCLGAPARVLHGSRWSVLLPGLVRPAAPGALRGSRAYQWPVQRLSQWTGSREQHSLQHSKQYSVRSRYREQSRERLQREQGHKQLQYPEQGHEQLQYREQGSEQLHCEQVNEQLQYCEQGREQHEQHEHYERRWRGRRFPRCLFLGPPSALVFQNIEPDSDPRGKTRTEKMLELSRKQLDDEISERRARRSAVTRFFITYVWQPLLTWFRFVHLVTLFLPIMLLGLPMLVPLLRPPAYRHRWYHSLRWTLEAAGPSFIKLGQWAASRADIFPQELCEELAQLHSNAKMHSMTHTRQVVADAFGKPFEQCFSEFDETPLGVGAMGQVYKARLDDEDFHGYVAVKVLHPGIETMIQRDLSIMMIFATIINALPTMEWLSLPGEVDSFGRMMQSQLDLRLEAENLSIFNAQFAKNDDIAFPRTWLGVSTRQLLVEQLVVGVSMEKVLKFGNQSPFDRRIAALGLDAFLSMLILNNFIHADLHAGNIFLTLPNNKAAVDALNKASTQEEWDKEWTKLDEHGTPNLCFIDAGLVTELNPTDRANFLDLFKAIATFDGYRAGELMIERSRTPNTVVDKEVFALKTQRLVNHVKKRTFALGSVGIGDLLAQMMDMVRKHHVRMESDFITVVLSILLLEGIGRRLDPHLDIFKSALPVLRKASQQQASSLPLDTLSSEETLQMLKVWLVLETRQFITASVQDIYRCVKYDRLSPNV